MNLADRLRAVVRSGDSADLATRFGTSTAASATDALANRANADRAAEGLGGEWREVRARSAAESPSDITGVSGRQATRPRYLLIDRQYPTGHRLGRVTVSDCLPVTDGLWPRANLLMSGDRGPAALPGQLCFLTWRPQGWELARERTRFSLGAVGLRGLRLGFGSFSSAATRRSVDCSKTLPTRWAAFGGLVTYNGKSFDLPLIDTRFLFYRLSASYSGLPYLDMLHIARRLWRSASATQSSMGAGERLSQVPCRFTHIEQTVLGHVRNGDVPGFEIPSRYFHYVRTGDTRLLESVLEHNRLDLLALAMLTATASQLLETGAGGARTAREALGLGQLFERAGMLAEAARADPAVALYIDVDSPTCAEAWRAYGVLCRRVLALPHCPTQIAQQASEALAVHHEHRVRDLSAARCFAMQALTLTAAPRVFEL